MYFVCSVMYNAHIVCNVHIKKDMLLREDNITWNRTYYEDLIENYECASFIDEHGCVKFLYQYSVQFKVKSLLYVISNV